MSLSLEEKIRVYTEYWEELNALSALIADLEAKRSGIKAKQRQLANSIAHLYQEEREAELREPES
jgi:hypothetical protein